MMAVPHTLHQVIEVPRRFHVLTPKLRVEGESLRRLVSTSGHHIYGCGREGRADTSSS